MKPNLKPILCASALFLMFAPACAQQVVVGVNTVGVERTSEAQQDALIEQLHENGVRTVRTGLGDTFTHFIIRAYRRGIGAVLITYPTQEGGSEHMRPADKSVGLQWAAPAITDADPEKFRLWLARQLEVLETAGVRVTAFELGNEINGPFFNGDFLPALASGRVLGLSDLDNPDDPEGRAIAASYRAYLQVMATLKDVRDHSKLNGKTPIISAGLADGGLPGKKPGQKLDGVSIPATLEFLRQNGLDKLVDGYGVHAYPSGDPKTPLSARIDALSKQHFAMCSRAKPCWLTEWGFSNRSQSCPINEETRMQLIRNERDAFETFVKQRRLSAILFYSWSGLPWVKESQDGIFRCGSLTDAGKVALSPMS
jgi:hypothetical protein